MAFKEWNWASPSSISSLMLGWDWLHYFNGISKVPDVSLNGWMVGSVLRGSANSLCRVTLDSRMDNMHIQCVTGAQMQHFLHLFWLMFSIVAGKVAVCTWIDFININFWQCVVLCFSHLFWKFLSLISCTCVSCHSFHCHFHHRGSLSLSLLFVLFTGLSAWARCPTSSTAKATPSCQAEKGACFPEPQDHALTSPPFLFWHHCAYCCRSALS